MIQKKMPKDIRTFKTKVVGSLTLRQLILLIVTFLVDVVLYNFVIEPLHLPLDALIYIFIPIDLLILVFSFEPMGMPMEKYLKLIAPYYMRPKIRKDENIIYEKEEYVPKRSAKELKQRAKEIEGSLEISH